MAHNERLDVIYSNQMQNHPEGHALYKDVSATKLRPAVCGYFDRNGDWKTVVDLGDSNALRLDNWTALDGMLIETDPGQTYWGPKHSTHVRDINGGIKAEINTANAPVGGTIEASFKSSKEHGAVLITDPPVRYHQAGNEKVFIKWMSDNSRALLQHPTHGEMIREFGAWIVTKTYTTTRRAVAVLSSTESVVNVTFGVTVANVGKLAPTAGWWNRASESAWSMHNEPAGVVVFMSGVEFRPRFMSKTKLKPEVKKSKQSTTRGGGFVKDNIPPITIPTEGDDENVLQLVPTIVGEYTSELDSESENDNEEEEDEED